VFPKAELKIFLVADPAVRVERRFRELVHKNPNITIDEVKSNLEMRDYIDSNREVSPLKQAKDAIVIDNSNMSVKDQMKVLLKLVREKMEVLQGAEA
jgi:cytidylate kinase